MFSTRIISRHIDLPGPWSRAIANLHGHGIDLARRLHAASQGGPTLPWHTQPRDPARTLARIARGLRRLYLLCLVLSGTLHCTRPAPRRMRDPDRTPRARRPNCISSPRRTGLPDLPIGRIAAGIARDLGISPGHDLYPRPMADIALTPAQWSARLVAHDLPPHPADIEPDADPPRRVRAPDLLAGIAVFAPLSPARPRSDTHGCLPDP